jgi:hypothetical protein
MIRLGAGWVYLDARVRGRAVFEAKFTPWSFSEEAAFLVL